MRVYACITDLNFSGNTILHPVASIFPPLSIITLDFDARILFGWESWSFSLPASHEGLAVGIAWEVKAIRS